MIFQDMVMEVCRNYANCDCCHLWILLFLPQREVVQSGYVWAEFFGLVVKHINL